MGTFLGNLTVLGASAEAVAALLPGTTVGRWSERFVTVLHDGYGMGTVERPARALSKALPQAAVLSAALVDSDLLELTVWQGGGRVTTRAHFPYDGVSKRGDARKFCAALGLPEEDIPRLKALWAKGDAEEQLELTAALLGAPLYCDTQTVPTRIAHRDAQWVDDWLAQRPDPPKVRNQTRAQLVQELTGLEPLHMFCPGSGGYYRLRRTDNGKKIFYRWTPQGDLTPEPAFASQRWLEDADCWDVCCHEAAPDRMVVERTQMVGVLLSGTCVIKSEGILADSAGLLSCPMPLELDGKGRNVNQMWAMPDGGVLIDYGAERLSVELDTDPDLAPRRDLARYTPDGALLWRKSLEPWKENARFLKGGLLWMQNSNRPEEEKYYALDLDGRVALTLSLPPLPQEEHRFFQYQMPECQPAEGEIWVVCRELDRRGGAYQYTLFRWTEDGRPLGRHPIPCDIRDDISILEDRVFAACFDEGIWALDGKDFSVLAAVEDHRSYMSLKSDAAGRIWVAVSDSVWECYDRDLNLLSRHRLKGGSVDTALDGEGCLRVMTVDEKNNVLRVYKMKEK